MFFEDDNLKIYSSEEINLMSIMELEECNLHVYEGSFEEKRS